MRQGEGGGPAIQALLPSSFLFSRRFPPTPPHHPASTPNPQPSPQAGAILKAQVYGSAVPEWAADAGRVVAAAAAVPVEAFRPKEGVKIETDPKAKAPSHAAHDDGAIEGLVAQLRGVAAALPAGSQLAAISFEKDDDTNFHMQV